MASKDKGGVAYNAPGVKGASAKGGQFPKLPAVQSQLNKQGGVQKIVGGR